MTDRSQVHEDEGSHGPSGRRRPAPGLVALVVLSCILALGGGLTEVASAHGRPGRDPWSGWSAGTSTGSSADTSTSSAVNLTAGTDPFSTDPILADPAASVPSVASQAALAPATSTSAQVTVGPGMAEPELLAESAPVQQAQLADMRDNLHITSIRIDANWEYVQYAGPDTFDWTQYDQLVRSVRAEGMSIDFLIDGTASWASASGALFAQPSDPGQFGMWASEVAARYGSGGPTTYEIWNEPNSAQFWQPAPDPAAYTADLTAAYQAIKAVQPHEMVISGGLAPESNDGTDINAVTFLQDMYADGAGGSFDAVGYHPYSYPALPDSPEPWSGWTQLTGTAPSIRSVMSDNGDSGKQVWLTEVGWPTDTTSLTGVDGDSAQAAEITQVLAFALDNPWVGPVYWFSYQDGADGPFGLVTSDGTTKPAYAVLASLG
jgi:hypothetical protein